MHGQPHISIHVIVFHQIDYLTDSDGMITSNTHYNVHNSVVLNPLTLCTQTELSQYLCRALSGSPSQHQPASVCLQSFRTAVTSTLQRKNIHTLRNKITWEVQFIPQGYRYYSDGGLSIAKEQQPTNFDFRFKDVLIGWFCFAYLVELCCCTKDMWPWMVGRFSNDAVKTVSKKFICLLVGRNSSVGIATR